MEEAGPLLGLEKDPGCTDGEEWVFLIGGMEGVSEDVSTYDGERLEAGEGEAHEVKRASVKGGVWNMLKATLGKRIEWKGYEKPTEE